MVNALEFHLAKSIRRFKKTTPLKVYIYDFEAKKNLLFWLQNQDIFTLFNF